MTWSDRAAGRRLRRALAALALLAGGCRQAPDRFALAPLVLAGRFAIGDEAEEEARANAPLRFAHRPEPATVEVGYERREAVLTTADAWSWRGRIPAAAELHAGVQLLPAAWQAVRALEVRVLARDGRTREVLEVARAGRRQERRWIDLRVDLARFAGREVTLELSASLAGLPPRYRQANLVAWAPVFLASSAPRPEGSRPNVLFILVDTLRADHTTPYGYPRETTPEIARRLARPGLVVEHAYSQAPWTLPSVVSLLTGRYPGELLGADPAAFGIPAGVPSLAERLERLGYTTGAFVANPTLHAGNGFARGFETFYSPPADPESMRLHGDSVTSRAVPWLAAHRGGPFFLYVHYIDPHDPYESPELLGGRSPFYPDYRGPIAGDWIHGIYTGRIPLRDPERDVAHIAALYDSEVHYVDRQVGELLAALSPETLAETIVVLTADHGEELHDHGGWKHGQTLYEEQIHVPLLFRWDGRIPAGRRLAGTVRLLDVVPTLLAAAGGEADPAWNGVDLLPALSGRGKLPRLPAFARHLASGPLRAAAVLDGRKLVLFNREEPFAPADELQEHLWRLDLGRLRTEEAYDLVRDPRERDDLVARSPGFAAALAAVVHRQLDAELSGLRVVAGPSSPGSRLDGTIEFERPPQRWVPYFLGPGDRVELDGARLRFALAGERREKGILVEGDFGGIRTLEVRLDGAPLPPGRVLLGKGVPYRGGPVAPGALRTGGRPEAGNAELRLWLRDPPKLPAASSEETERRLRALGYVQ